jgi:hypothetical protein
MSDFATGPEGAPPASDAVPERTYAGPHRTVTTYHEYEHGPKGYGRLSAAVKRVSWGAIFAGALVAVVAQLLLTLLGLGFGLSGYDPASDAGDSLGGFGMAQGVWTVVSSLLALFAGGWVAGRLAGMPRRTDGALHGVVVWALTTMLTLYLLTSGLGRVASGVTSLVGSGLQAAGQGIAAVAPDAARAAEDQLGVDLSEITLDDVRREATELLEDTGDPALQPGAIEDEAEEVADAARQQARDAATSPADARAELGQAVDRAFDSAGRIASEADRQDLVNVLVARTDLSEAEARRTVRQWEGRLDRARERAGDAVERVREQAPETAEAASDALGTAALVSFLALLLGVVAAAFGGLLGSPHDLPPEALRPAAYREDA